MSLSLFVFMATVVASIVAQSSSTTVNTPMSVQACAPTSISWTTQSPPVYVSLIPGGQPSAPALKDFGEQTGNQLTWNVDQPAGTSISVQIRDATGALNYSDKFTVQPSPGGATCSSSGSSAPAGKPASSGTPPASPAGGSSAATNSTKPGTAAASAPAGSTSSSSTPPSSGSTTAPSSSTATRPNSTAGASAPSSATRVIPGLIPLALSAAMAVFA